MTEQKVRTFTLNDDAEREEYEYILNHYERLKEEFDYMRDGTPKVTIWYAVEND